MTVSIIDEEDQNIALGLFLDGFIRHGAPKLTAEVDSPVPLRASEVLFCPGPAKAMFFLTAPSAVNSAVGNHPETAVLAMSQAPCFSEPLLSQTYC